MYTFQVTDFETEQRYSLLLKQMLDDHRDVVTMLADGFRETKKHLKVQQTFKFFASNLVWLL